MERQPIGCRSYFLVVSLTTFLLFWHVSERGIGRAATFSVLDENFEDSLLDLEASSKNYKRNIIEILSGSSCPGCVGNGETPKGNPCCSYNEPVMRDGVEICCADPKEACKSDKDCCDAGSVCGLDDGCCTDTLNPCHPLKDQYCKGTKCGAYQAEVNVCCIELGEFCDTSADTCCLGTRCERRTDNNCCVTSGSSCNDTTAGHCCGDCIDEKCCGTAGNTCSEEEPCCEGYECFIIPGDIEGQCQGRAGAKCDEFSCCLGSLQCSREVNGGAVCCSAVDGAGCKKDEDCCPGRTCQTDADSVKRCRMPAK